MKINVLYFARIREIVRIDEEVVEGDGTVKDFLLVIIGLHPELAEIVSSILSNTSDIALAVNTNIVADLTLALNENDELAFIPPISGG